MQKLVNNDAESIPIDTLGVALSKQNLRRHILWCAANGVGTVPHVQLLDEAEVGDFDEASRSDEKILRLQIAVHKHLGVHILKGKDDLRSIEHDVDVGHLVVLPERVHEVAALHMLKVHVDHSVVLRNAIEAEDERVREIRHKLYFVQQVVLDLIDE